MHLLLDFDGVVIKNHNAYKEVTKRCVNLVHKTIPNITKDQAALINKDIYENYGHTVYGLQKMGYSITMQDFNDIIYNDFDYDLWFRRLKDTNKDDVVAFEKLYDFCTGKNIPIYMFSNAPDSWCNNIMSNIDMEYTKIPSTKMFTSVLKPDVRSYHDIDNHITDDICFVDDKYSNLYPIIDRSKWIYGLWMNDSDEKEYSEKIKKIKSLAEVPKFII